MSDRDRDTARAITFAKDRFRVQRELGRGGMGVVYEARDTERNMQVALKTLLHMDPEALYYLKKEFRTLHDFVHPNLCSFIDLIEDDGVWLLTMELIHGTDFYSYIHEGRAALPLPSTRYGLKKLLKDTPKENEIETSAVKNADDLQFDENKLRLSLAGLCQGLSALHRVGKIHRDIKPSNVLVTGDGRTVLLDFGLVADMDLSHHNESSEIVGTAAYMAPEQAQGENVGPASDWYSVGVMLYEALTGELPFVGKPLKMIMDKQSFDPARPSEKRAGLPEDLETLCLALLQRDPEDRPSVDSVLEAARVAKTVPIVSASSEISHLSAGHQFVGRAAELGTLHQALEKMSQDSALESVIIEGVSGVGKSTLLEQFLTAALDGDISTVILKGRCYERESAPYKAFDGVIESLLRYLSSLTDEEARDLKPNNADLLIHLFPVLARSPIMSAIEHQRVAIQDPHELQSRAFEALKETLQRIGQRHPLIVLIDDMQWADADSLTLLQHLVRESDFGRLLLILSSRFAKNRETSCLDWESVVSRSFRRIHLRPLNKEDAETLADLYLSQYNLAYRLDGEKIVKEAEGHPFFITELIRHAAFGTVEWQSLKLDEMIWSRISTLPEVAISILETVAVIGTPISKHTLRSLTDHCPEEFSKSMLLLRANNLIRSSGPRSRDLVETYHDRVREAVVSNLEERDERKPLQLKIGRFFLKNWGTDQNDNIFEVVQHLSAARDLLTDKDELLRLGQLYYLAGRKARNTSAFVSSMEFFECSLELFSGVDWGDHYETILDLHVAAAETAYILGDFDKTDALVKRTMKRAKSDLDLAKIYEVYVLALQAHDHHLEALDEAVTMVRKLGVSLPRRPSVIYLLVNTLKTIFRLRGKKQQDILRLPQTTNLRITAATSLMAIMSPTSFFYLPELWIAIFLVALKLAVKHGIDKTCGIIFGGWGVMNCAVLGRYDEGYKYGKISLELFDKFEERHREDMALFVFATFVQHWKEHLGETPPFLKRAHRIAGKSGSLSYLGHTGANDTYHSFFLGLYLPDIAEQSAGYAELMVHKTQGLAYYTIQIFRQTMLNLIEVPATKDAALLQGEAYDQTVMLSRHKEKKRNINLWDCYSCNLVLSVLFGQWKRAVTLSSQAEKYRNFVRGTYSFAVFPFYAALACSKHLDEVPFFTKMKLRRLFAKHRRYVRRIAKFSRANHLHKAVLLDAEWARIRGKKEKASSLYHRAIEGAIENNFPNDAALASELAADFCREMDNREQARIYAQKAVVHYLKWGAFAKVEHLREKFNLPSSEPLTPVGTN